MTHQEYPLTMAHPAYQASKSVPVPGTERFAPDGVTIIASDWQGSPEKFPPVTAVNADDEEFYISQGYARAGQSDPAAYATALAAPLPALYEPEEYPKWIDGVLCQSAEDAAEMQGAVAHRPDSLEVGVTETIQTIDTVVQMTAADLAPVPDINALRHQYQEKFGKKPFAGWKADVLLEKIAA